MYTLEYFLSEVRRFFEVMSKKYTFKQYDLALKALVIVWVNCYDHRATKYMQLAIEEFNSRMSYLKEVIAGKE